MGRTAAVLAMAVMAAAGGTASVASPAEDPCPEQRTVPPHDPYSAECFDAIGTPKAELAASRALVGRWAAEHPEEPWILAGQANATGEKDSATAAQILQRAAELFAGRHDAAGEAYARFRRVYHLTRLGRYPEAEAELERARGLAGANDDAALEAIATVADMKLLDGMDRGSDTVLVGRRAVAADWFGRAPKVTRWLIATQGEGAAYYGSQLDDLRRFSSIALANVFDPKDRPRLSSQSEAEFQDLAASLGVGSAEEAKAAVERAYEMAAASNIFVFETEMACQAAKYATEPEEIRTWTGRCAELAKRFHCQQLQCMADRFAAVRLAERPENREQALRLTEETTVLARESGDLILELHAADARAAVRALTGPRDQAIREFEATLSLIETLRAYQDDPQQRMDIFLVESAPYRYAQLLALDTDDPSEDDRQRAFTVIEQARARGLEDSFAVARGALPQPVTSPEAAALADVRARAEKIRESLQSGMLSEEATASALRELDGLDAAESIDLLAMLKRDPAWAASYRPAVPSVATVRSALEPGEALLSFQIPVYPGAPPWAFVLTRERADVVRLPADDLRIATELYRGLLQRRDGSDRDAARAVSAALLAPALQRLDPSIDRLIIVPDGPLWQIPIPALPHPATGEPLAARFEISIVPSATSWLRWRASVPDPPSADGFGVADPILPDAAEATDTHRGWALTAVSGHGRLPHAREEVLAMMSSLGRGSKALFGREASETAFKRRDLRPFGVLHFAAHAVVNVLRASRSGILLSRVAPEDGILDAREIALLPLKGKLVVLSSCGTAEGRYVVGEGALSLTHAFLAAGARTVVSTLWPVADRDAADLMKRFYLHLGTGEPAGVALARAQRDLMGAGAPPAAWAGFELVGDGGFRLPAIAAHPPPGDSRGPLWLAAIGGAALAAALIWRWRQRATRRHAK